MGITIDCAGKEALDLRNITFASFHRAMAKECKKNKYPSTILIFLEKTDQDLYGAGGIGLVDIVDFFKTKHDILLFAFLVKQAIEEEQQSEYPFSQEAYERLISFYNELLNYVTTLEE